MRNREKTIRRYQDLDQYSLGLAGWKGGTLSHKSGKDQKGGITMKTKRTIITVAVIGALALLCSHFTVSAAHAQGSPDFSGWYAAMAMANLAEQEIRENERQAVARRDVQIAQNTAAEEKSEYLKDLEEKNDTEK